MQSHILKLNFLEGQDLAAADINGDALIDVLDLVLLVDHQLGSGTLSDCAPLQSDQVPSIRFISPGFGPPGTRFTLVGHGFSPIAAQNQVVFFRPEGTFTAPVGGAGADRVFGVVPAGVDYLPYRVTVMVAGQESNGVGFEVRATIPGLEIVPSDSSLLLPPGSGREILAIGGGTPPYHLTPLMEDQRQVADVHLEREVVEISGKQRGYVTIEVTDSANPPASDEASVEVREPSFNPNFELIPHTLLAGSSPGFTVLFKNYTSDMHTRLTEVEMNNFSADLEGAVEGTPVGIGRQIYLGRPQDFQMLLVESNSGDSLALEGLNLEDGGLRTGAIGGLSTRPVRLEISPIPEPAPEALVRLSFVQEILLRDGLLQLPEAGGVPLDITATFTSTPVFEGEESSLVKVENPSSLTTQSLAEGAPRVERLLPVIGPAGQLVQIMGSGFSALPEENSVSFQGESGQRVEVPVEWASENELRIRVPLEAVTGPLQISVDGIAGNDYLFFPIFRAQARLLFSDFQAGTPTTPLLMIRQFKSPRYRGLDQDIGARSAEVEIAKGRFSLADLEVGETAGSALLYSDSSTSRTDYVMIYGGIEENEAGRHFFELKTDPESATVVATLYVSGGAEKGPVLVELPQFPSLLGRVLRISFSKPLYVPPQSAGTAVEIRTRVWSIPWNVLGDEMVVTTATEMVTP